jgi:hypothetical protein
VCLALVLSLLLQILCVPVDYFPHVLAVALAIVNCFFNEYPERKPNFSVEDRHVEREFIELVEHFNLYRNVVLVKSVKVFHDSSELCEIGALYPLSARALSPLVKDLPGHGIRLAVKLPATDH